MKDVGITRKVDKLGRVVIPIEIRRQLGITIKDELGIYVQGRKVVFEKSPTSCIICNSGSHLHNFEGQLFCDNCIKKLAKVSVLK